jgi:hypothetical protein
MHVGSNSDGERYARRESTRLSHQAGMLRSWLQGGTDRQRGVARLQTMMRRGCVPKKGVWQYVDVIVVLEECRGWMSLNGNSFGPRKLCSR